jgi:molybdopterin synthase catalytic subunit
MENPPVHITLGPDPCPEPPGFRSGIHGAEVVFLGRVRGEENGRPIAGIEYTAYEAMALREMERIAARLQEEHGPHPVRIHHRTGFVPNGEASLLLAVAGRHSAETFALCSEYLRLIKESVPVWKRPVWAP